MAYITLFTSDRAMNYPDATDIRVDEHGALIFSYREAGSGAARKITTTVPYMIAEQIKS